jgi:hypothetical protein
MPSIEIVCLEQEDPIDFSHLPFAVRGDRELRSHRIPSPLFQADFDRMHGCMYHLGNPEIKRPGYRGAFYAVRLLVKEDLPRSFLQFRPEFRMGVYELLARLLQASPIKTLFFTSDYRWGPDDVTLGGEMTLARFWQFHETQSLRVNGCYTILEDSIR